MIRKYGQEHMETGVGLSTLPRTVSFQIAAHEQVIPVGRVVCRVPDGSGAADRRERRWPGDRQAFCGGRRLTSLGR